MFRLAQRRLCFVPYAIDVVDEPAGRLHLDKIPALAQ